MLLFPTFHLFFPFFLSLLPSLFPPLFPRLACYASLRPHGKLRQFVLLCLFTSNHHTLSTTTTTTHITTITTVAAATSGAPQTSMCPNLRIGDARSPAREPLPVV